MDRRYDGQILHGTINGESNELTVTSIKTIPTQSVWCIEQIREMLDQTTKAMKLNMGITVTVRDSIPLVLENKEIEKLNMDIQEIQSILKMVD